MHREENRHDFAFIAGVIVGAISGALVTLALTPMSGSETRERVMERVGDLEPMKERAAGLATTGKHLMETSREKAVEMVAKSPLPFGEHVVSEPGGTPTPAATVTGGVAHSQQPAEGNGFATTESPARPS